jgi:hypothetical protein
MSRFAKWLRKLSEAGRSRARKAKRPERVRLAVEALEVFLADSYVAAD